ncbi:hypothetical protein FA15DRAFT_662898 [Coprinopsis marcescibilis]|uniref:Uncharacterized protein n=1 Tax=Coprinopsis marcescibilis TaxID=230819 RepID=A0A5C3LDE4_COPMA|nr:hypothetical protein FA15DRAFT_662898 [Coprinopsis marcescibilis]
MATRRRIGVSIASTEAARRQLMQPVQSWERVLVPSDVNASVKVFKWMKTDKVQHFSDDEGDVDEPLAPLPDEPEIVDGDEEMEQDDATAAPSRAEPATKEIVEAEPTEEPLSKAPSPKPQLSMSTDVPGPADIGEELDSSLKLIQQDVNMDDNNDDDEEKKDDGLGLNISGLGPDGLQQESSHDLSQLDGTDALAGGNVMDQTGDPFAPVS